MLFVYMEEYKKSNIPLLYVLVHGEQSEPSPIFVACYSGELQLIIKYVPVIYNICCKSNLV